VPSNTTGCWGTSRQTSTRRRPSCTSAYWPSGRDLDGHLSQSSVLVDLVGDAQLVIANDLVVRDLLVPRAADEMLRGEQRIAQYGFVADHVDELFGRHGLLEPALEESVVNLLSVVLVRIFCPEARTGDSQIGTLTRSVGAMQASGADSTTQGIPLPIYSRPEADTLVFTFFVICSSIGICRWFLPRMGSRYRLSVPTKPNSGSRRVVCDVDDTADLVR